MINSVNTTYVLPTPSSGQQKSSTSSNQTNEVAASQAMTPVRKTTLTAATVEQVKLAYDKPDQRHSKAIHQYEDIAKAPAREAISETFGVDLYA
ncbi:hypothetical protein [Motilimonas pumila]|uniref:Uncharacterized protein n=1 Tax=Motilimonas pumila TaxID=2303987 RepID=A0A418YD97_9GAMM|nr:hypothetical protein [Motilimonas pumila]RJG42516.1 hypothetical protein D1Z90_12685 [Motilimonas pumila]